MIAVAILSAILIYAIADAVSPQYTWKDCGGYPKGPYVAAADTCPKIPVDTVASAACSAQGYTYQATYGADSCISGYECSTCYKDNDDQQARRNLIFFYTTFALGIIGIVVGFLLPRDAINEWVGLGAIIGGVIGLFIGTVSYWGNLSRFARPFVIALELAIVLFIIYKRMRLVDEGEVRSSKKK